MMMECLDPIGRFNTSSCVSVTRDLEGQCVVGGVLGRQALGLVLECARFLSLAGFLSFVGVLRSAGL